MQRHNDYVHYESDAIGRRPAQAAARRGRRPRSPQAAEIRVFQSTLIYKPPRPRRAEQPRALALRPALLADLHLRPDADRLHPLPRLRRGDGHHHHGRRQPPLEGDGRNDDSTRHFAAATARSWTRSCARTADFNGAEVRKVPVVIPRGHVSFHHCRTYHGSGANLSDRPRRAISLHLQDGANQYRPLRRARRQPARLQPRRAGAPHRGRPPRLRRPGVLPGDVARPR